jgi:MoaA/NifB/PqqE/SkfB family radical SAM enzyme
VLELTKKCPLNCLICSSCGGEPYPNELSLNEWKNVIDQAVELGVKRVSLSGGEPFAYKNFDAVCRYIYGKNLDLEVYTSGSDGRFQAISEYRFKRLKNYNAEIVFNLSGASQKDHENLTGTLVSYHNLLASIENAYHVGIKRSAHFVPTQLNYKTIKMLIFRLYSMRFDSIHIMKFIPQGRGKINRKILELSKDQLNEFENLLAESYVLCLPITIGANFNELSLVDEKPCTAGTEKALIRADGYVFPCPAVKGVFPCSDGNNIRKTSLRHIVSSPFFTCREFGCKLYDEVVL